MQAPNIARGRAQINLCRPAVFRPARCAQRTVIGRADVAAVGQEGDKMWNTTYYPKLCDTKKLEKDWFVIDAEGQTLGRLACLVARYLRGKHAATYTPSMDMGAMVIVINAEKVQVSGTKEFDKVYKRHPTGVPGSMKQESFRDLQARIPERIIEKAVWGMLPKGRLGRRIKLNMWVYKGPEHPHVAQQPTDITAKINGRY